MEKISALVVSLALACILAGGSDSGAKAQAEYRQLDSVRNIVKLKTPQLERKNDTILLLNQY